MSEGLFGGWIGEKSATSTITGTIVNEQLIGTVNGINTVFTTSQNYVLNSETVWFDGVRMEKNVDYTRSGVNQITFMVAPLARAAPKCDSIVSIQYTPE
ncbi:hypothetical protein OAF54_03170 [bacterium]|nr:hypothetical protein [bacterium]